MTAPDLKCECGTVLADGGPVGLYCPNRECQIEQDMAAKAYKAMRDRKRLAEALEVPEVAALVEVLRWIAQGEMTVFNGTTGESYIDDLSGAAAIDRAHAALRAIGGDA